MSDAAPTSPAPASDAAHKHQGHFSAAIRTVSGLTLLSRFAGLARDVITARIFGSTAIGSAFRAAYAIPNLFRRLFGEGALSAAFLPEYTRLRKDDPDAADQLATLVVRVLMLTTGVITLLVEAILAAIYFLRPHDAELGLSLKLMMLLLPMMPMVCATAILGGILQANGKFAVPAAAPILLNLFQIAAGALVYAGIVNDKPTAAYLVGGAALLASIAQIIWSLAGLRGVVRWSRVTAAAAYSAGLVRSRFFPALLGLGTLQLSTFLDMLIAMWPNWFGPTMFGRPISLDKSSNAILSFTQTLYQFPLGVFGIAVATAVFPLLSRNAGDPTEFAATLRRGVRLSLFIALPASLGLILTRHELVTVVFGSSHARDANTSHGFSADGLARAADVLFAFSTAVWAYSVNHTLTRAFYAKGDTKTPMRIAIGAVLLNLTLNLSLIWSLREAGLAWATAASATVQCLALLILLRAKHGVTALDRETSLACLKIAAAVAIMGGATFGVSRILPAPASWLATLLNLAALVITGAASYALAAWALRCPELRWLLHPAPRDAGGKVIGMSFE